MAHRLCSPARRSRCGCSSMSDGESFCRIEPGLRSHLRAVLGTWLRGDGAAGGWIPAVGGASPRRSLGRGAPSRVRLCQLCLRGAGTLSAISPTPRDSRAHDALRRAYYLCSAFFFDPIRVLNSWRALPAYLSNALGYARKHTGPKFPCACGRYSTPRTTASARPARCAATTLQTCGRALVVRAWRAKARRCGITGGWLRGAPVAVLRGHLCRSPPLPVEVPGLRVKQGSSRYLRGGRFRASVAFTSWSTLGWAIWRPVDPQGFSAAPANWRVLAPGAPAHRNTGRARAALLRCAPCFRPRHHRECIRRPGVDRVQSHH